MIAQSLVFVVDDDSSVRRALRRLLTIEGFAVEAFSSAEGFLSHDRDVGSPSCLILDVRMPGGADGLQLQQQLEEASSLLPIIFITGHGTVPMSVQAMKAGACEFLQKPFDNAKLLAAVREALVRSRAACDRHRALNELRGRAKRLRGREHEVFALVVQGLLNKQIASRLGVAEKTIKVHRGRVMGKMEATSVAELVRMADSLGLKTADLQ